MLILSRRCGESIIVDDEVTLTVLSIKGKQVRIGIDAPDHVSVHREEIYQRIKDGDNPAQVGKDSQNASQDASQDASQELGGADSSVNNAAESDSPHADSPSNAKSPSGSQVAGNQDDRRLRAVAEVDRVAQVEVSAPAATPIVAKAGDPKLV